jgi:protein involved in polysaccharide export with SLBB domain
MILKNSLKAWIALILLAVMTVGTAWSHLQLLRVRPGDTLSIHIIGVDGPNPVTGGPPGLKYQVLSDGTIESHDFGVVKVEGLTIPDITRLVRKKLSAKYNNPEVSIVVDNEAPLLVFLSGTKTSTGPMKLLPGMDLRHLLASAELDENPDQYEAHVFRAGAPERKAVVHDILSGSSPLATLKLENNDVVTILPLDFVRVWVTGDVAHPGQVMIQKGDDVYRAIAAAGGVLPSLSLNAEGKIGLRRGPNSISYPLKQDPKARIVALEAGDTIVVNNADRIIVTVSGEVKNPGRFELNSGSVLDQAVAEAGGLTNAGTGREVTVLRDGRQLSADVASSTSLQGLGSFGLQDHDVVLVKQNTRFAIVTGYVKIPGRVYIPDGQPMHLIDIVSGAGGITEAGTARHLYVGHPDASGRMRIKEVRLDSYLRRGDPHGNPLIVPGDLVTVYQSQTPTIQIIEQALSGAVLLYGVSQL